MLLLLLLSLVILRSAPPGVLMIPCFILIRMSQCRRRIAGRQQEPACTMK